MRQAALPDGYRIRQGTTTDIPAIVHRDLFAEMRIALDADAMRPALTDWLSVQMSSGTYLAWVVEHDGIVVAGAGITLLPWPDHGSYLAGCHWSTTSMPNRHTGGADLPER
jgi:hypothetical protein